MAGKIKCVYLVLRAAAMTLRTVLLSLQALLAAAEPDDPQDAVVANQVRLIMSSHVAFMGTTLSGVTAELSSSCKFILNPCVGRIWSTFHGSGSIGANPALHSSVAVSINISLIFLSE